MQKPRRIWSGGLTVVAKASILLLVAATLSACGEDSPSNAAVASEQSAEEAPVSTVEIVAYDFGYRTSPEVVPAGPIETRLTNEGEQPHQALIYRLNDGIAFEDFKNKIMADDTLVPQLAQGGIDGVSEVISTGKETVATGDELTPGRYAILCFVRDQSLETTKNHAELGMVAPLSVE